MRILKFKKTTNNMAYNKYSPAQKKLASVAPPRKKITKADFTALKKRKRG